mgnify:CR=1 FL=1
MFNPEKLPAFHDPFAGGGSIPLEAQRLGLEAYASDLNPVAVLINKAMIEIPPKFAGQPPVNPEDRKKLGSTAKWKGAAGLAADVRYYGKWMRDEAEKRIGHLYPKVLITPEMVAERPDLKPYQGRELTVIAWLWARTVKSPNPAFRDVDVPLASTFMLSTKPGKEAYVEPIVEGRGYRFAVKVGKPRNAEQAKNGTKLARANFACLVSGVPIEGDYIKAEGMAKRMGARLMAIVAEGDRGRVYLAPTSAHEAAAGQANPEWRPEVEIAKRMTGGNCTPYGLTTFGDLFTDRQLVALTTFSDLVGEAREQVKRDALAAGLPDDSRGIDDGGTGAQAYADAVAVYLAFALDKVADRGSSLGRWDPTPTQSGIINTYSRQALPMTWDFAESNPLGQASGNYVSGADLVAKVLEVSASQGLGQVAQEDATTQNLSAGRVVSTDPPYYDNIGYADLSDFFYVWLRRALREVAPSLFATVAVPKAEELVATPYRHGDKEKAEKFFLDGMTAAMRRLAEQAHPAFPVTIYYAFKQSETKGEADTASTGWETFLEAVKKAGLSVSGTDPMRTELSNRMIGAGTNALASSIVLTCWPRPNDAATSTRAEFLRELETEMHRALPILIKGGIAAVDLQQAAIGPGMAVFTGYRDVLEASDNPMSVRTALRLIDEKISEVLFGDSTEYDSDTRWALAWFEQYRNAEGPYGTAETLATGRGIAVDGLKRAGIIQSGGGKVRLLDRDELDPKWDPTTDSRLTVWEVTQHLIRVLLNEGEERAGDLLAACGSAGEPARDLAYRLFLLCERKGWAAEAGPYNALAVAWPALAQRAATAPRTAVSQASLL